MTRRQIGKEPYYRDAQRLRVLMMQSVTGGATPIDHGLLTGLGDDDHLQYVHLSAARSITGQHTFAPTSPQAPFVLNANAQGQTVTGFRADQLNKTLTAGNGLSGGGVLTADRSVALQTPGTLSATSTNVAAGNHTHAITASANPGAAEAILKSSASGGLRLEEFGIGAAPLAGGIRLTDTAAIQTSGDCQIYFENASNRIRIRTALRIQSSSGDNAEFTVSTGGLLTITADGDIEFDPVGDDILPVTPYDLNLGSQQRKYLTLHAAELWVQTLIAENVVATIGGRIVVAPTTTLIADVASVDTTVDVKHNEAITNDIFYMEADGKVEFMRVNSSATPITGGYRYTVVRNLDGSGANDWFAGDAIVNTGQGADGFIDIYSQSGVTAGSTTGPTIVGNIRNSITYNDWVSGWALGNLDGIYGYSTDTYGMGVGRYQDNFVHMVVDPTNGIRFRRRASSTNTVIGHWQPGGDFILGEVATDKANLFWDQSEGRLNFRGGTAGTVTELYLDSDGTVYAGGGTVLINTDGITIETLGGTSPTGNNPDPLSLDFYYLDNARITGRFYNSVTESGGLPTGSSTWATSRYPTDSAGQFAIAGLGAAIGGAYPASAIIRSEYGDDTENVFAVALSSAGGTIFTINQGSVYIEEGLKVGSGTHTATPVPQGVIAITDGVSAPATLSGYAQFYVDTTDGDLKVKFGDGTIKTIVTDT